MPPDLGPDPGYIRAFFGASNGGFVEGQTVWMSFRMYGPPSFFYEPWARNITDDTGPKFGALADWQNFHTSSEIVPGDHMGLCSPHGYLNGATYDFQEVAVSTWASGSDIRAQSEIDRGLNPLTGLNPDTGAAWTQYEQDRARWGPLYSAKNAQKAITGRRNGIGDWLSGQFRTPVGQWFTYTFRLDIGNWNTPNSRWRVWIAPQGLPYVKIKDHQNCNVGADDGPYNTGHLSHYVTERAAGGRHVSSRTNNITGVTIHAVGGPHPAAIAGTPLGAGTLSWNASTQRLTFAANGESAGPAVGFSAANGKLLRNVFSGTSMADGNNKFLIVEFDPANLPVTNQTDTVTIADGRPATHANYAELIFSTQPINAPGGFAPTGS